MVGPAIPGRCGRRLRSGALAALVSLPLLVDLARRTPAPRIALALALALAAESVGLLLGGGQAAHAQTLDARVGPSAGDVTLVWNRSSNKKVTWYQYRVSEVGRNWQAWRNPSVIVPLGEGGRDAAQFMFTVTSLSPGTSLTAGTRYRFQVRGVNENEASKELSRSASVQATPSSRDVALRRPTGLKAEAGPGAGEVTLTWDNPKNNLVSYGTSEKAGITHQQALTPLSP